MPPRSVHPVAVPGVVHLLLLPRKSSLPRL
jgi:hypothetical protein